MSNTDNKIGYELFLPAITTAVRGKKKNDNQLSDAEFKATVQIAFRDAMAEFTKDSLLYTDELAIDVYEGNQRYELIAPKGFLIEDVVEIKDHKIKVPPHCFDNNEVTLNCCPTKTVYEAFYVEVALSQMRSAGLCTYPAEFVERYYGAILQKMFSILTLQTEREWGRLTLAEFYDRKYAKALAAARRHHASGGGKLIFNSPRLTDNASC